MSQDRVCLSQDHVCVSQDHVCVCQDHVCVSYDHVCQNDGHEGDDKLKLPIGRAGSSGNKNTKHNKITNPNRKIFVFS